MAKVMLNMGCGNDIKPGYINCDKRNYPGVAKVFDVTVVPWPFPDNYADEILASALFEHIPDLLPVLKECHRVLVDRYDLIVTGPTPDSKYLWLDITHVRAFTEGCFDHFDPLTQLGSQFHYYPPTFHVIDTYLFDDGNMIGFRLECCKGIREGHKKHG